jgi:hypothetical protein
MCTTTHTIHVVQHRRKDKISGVLFGQDGTQYHGPITNIVNPRV